MPDFSRKQVAKTNSVGVGKIPLAGEIFRLAEIFFSLAKEIILLARRNISPANLLGLEGPPNQTGVAARRARRGAS